MLKRAGGLDGGQGLDGAGKGAVLEYDAVGEFGVTAGYISSRPTVLPTRTPTV